MDFRNKLSFLDRSQWMQLTGVLLLLLALPLLVLMVGQIQNFRSKAYINNCGLAGGADAAKYIQVIGLEDCLAPKKDLKLNLTSPFDKETSFNFRFLKRFSIKEATAQSLPSISEVSWITKSPLHPKYKADLVKFAGSILIKGSGFTSSTSVFHSIGGTDEERLIVLEVIDTQTIVAKAERPDGLLPDFGYLRACNGTSCSAYPKTYNLNIGPFIEKISWKDSSKKEIEISGKGFGNAGSVFYSRGGADVRSVNDSSYGETGITIPRSIESMDYGYIRICRDAKKVPPRSYACSDFVNYDLRPSEIQSENRGIVRKPAGEEASGLNIRKFCLLFLEDTEANRVAQKIEQRLFADAKCSSWPDKLRRSVENIDIELPSMDKNFVMWVLFKDKNDNKQYYYYRIPTKKSPQSPAIPAPDNSDNSNTTEGCKETAEQGKNGAVDNPKKGAGTILFSLAPLDALEVLQKEEINAPFYKFNEGKFQFKKEITAKLQRQDSDGKFNCIGTIKFTPKYEKAFDEYTVGAQELWKSENPVNYPLIFYPEANHTLEYFSKDPEVEKLLPPTRTSPAFKFNCSGTTCKTVDASNGQEIYQYVPFYIKPEDYKKDDPGLKPNYHFWRVGFVPHETQSLSDLPSEYKNVEIEYKDLKTFDGKTLPDLVFKKLTLKRGQKYYDTGFKRDGFMYYLIITPQQENTARLEYGNPIHSIKDIPLFTYGEMQLTIRSDFPNEAPYELKHPYKIVFSDNFRVTILDKEYGIVKKE